MYASMVAFFQVMRLASTLAHQPKDATMKSIKSFLLSLVGVDSKLAASPRYAAESLEAPVEAFQHHQ